MSSVVRIFLLDFNVKIDFCILSLMLIFPFFLALDLILILFGCVRRRLGSQMSVKLLCALTGSAVPVFLLVSVPESLPPEVSFAPRSDRSTPSRWDFSVPDPFSLCSLRSNVRCPS